MKKTVSIIVPCFNEEDNVVPMAETLVSIMDGLSAYDYELIFRDNASTDETVERLRVIAKQNPKIKVIVNCRNYGGDPTKNTYKGRVSGDILIFIPCDFQEPPELIPQFLEWYEKGYEVVAGQKTGSKEGKIKFALRRVFYGIIGSFSDIPQYRNMSGIYLYSRRVFDLMASDSSGRDPRFFLADLGCPIKLIQYEQQQRRSGQSSYNIWRYLQFAINSMIRTSTAPLRIATVLGLISSIISFVIGIVYLIMKLVWWNRFNAGSAPTLIGMFFLGSVLLFFVGILGEYIGVILNMVTPKAPPMVRELINFSNSDNDPYLVRSVSDQEKG